VFDPISNPTTGQGALRATRIHLDSARPDAPVVVEQARAPRTDAVRAQVAGRLRSVARWVEPAPRRTCQPG
jgi:hypothetical protein